MAVRLGRAERKKRGKLRRSQMITTYGPGSLVDMPRFSGIMGGTDGWDVKSIKEEKYIHERNLESLLGRDFFVQPVTEPSVGRPAQQGIPNKTFGIPVSRFPSMYYCPECNMLDKFILLNKNDRGDCNKCGTPLIPSRFIVACINGHIEDFPFEWWVHRGEKCHDGELARLSLDYEGKTGGLNSIIVSCRCGKKRTMEGCMSKDALRGFKCSGKMPWLGKNYRDSENCTAPMRTLQRGASNVYYSITQSALTIPPWSSDIQEFINAMFTFFKLTMKIPGGIENAYKELNIKEKFKCRLEEFEKQVQLRFSGEEEAVTPESIITAEYVSLKSADKDEKDFKTSSEEVPIDFAELLAEVKLVKRLREVQVLKGFRRILPEYDPEQPGAFGDRDYCQLSKDNNQNWLPAVELFGEGIFIRFSEELVAEWEERNRERYRLMESRLGAVGVRNKEFSPRYVLLHTFSHLLIRRLTFMCGYSSSALKEKIYSSDGADGENMCGILIYTASSDSDGSLGGLVREGRTERMSSVLNSLLEEATWCSSDPVCIDSTAQGMESLNYAACHACALLPENSCESRNCLLDRGSVVGVPDNPGIGYFQSIMEMQTWQE